MFLRFKKLVFYACIVTALYNPSLQSGYPSLLDEQFLPPKPVIDFQFPSITNLNRWFHVLYSPNLLNELQPAGYINTLINDLNIYKTSNAGFHAGHLLAHSVWVEKAIAKWQDRQDPEHFWCEGLSERDLYIGAWAGFLHDIGKAGAYGTTKTVMDSISRCIIERWYHEKKMHPLVGFQYIQGITPYILTNSFDKFNFQKFLKILGFDEEERKLIAVLVGAHKNFGSGMVKAVAQGEDLDKAANRYFTQLQNYVDQAEYNNGVIDERLLRLSMLIGAADVKGSQPQLGNRSLIFERIIRVKKAHNPPDMYEKFHFDTDGKKAREYLLRYFHTKWQSIY